MQTKNETKPVIEMGDKVVIDSKECTCVQVDNNSAILIDNEDNEYELPLSAIAELLSDQSAAKKLHSSTIYMTAIAFFMRSLLRTDKKGNSALDVSDLKTGDFKAAIQKFKEGSEIIVRALRKKDYNFIVNNQEVLIDDVEKRFEFAAALIEASMYIQTEEKWEEYMTELSKVANRIIGDNLLVEADDDK